MVAVAAAAAVTDRVGLGWRGELAAGIFEHIDRIDVLEVIAEDWLHAPRREATALAVRLAGRARGALWRAEVSPAP